MSLISYLIDNLLSTGVLLANYNSDEVLFYLPQNLVVSDDLTLLMKNNCTGYVFLPYFHQLKTTPDYLKFAAKEFRINKSEFLTVLSKKIDSTPEFSCIIESQKSQFTQDFHAIKNAIQNKIISKSVPISQETWSFSHTQDPRLFWIYKALSNENLNGCFYFLQGPYGGMTGVSPESLFHIQKVNALPMVSPSGNHFTLKTMALAGTLPKKNLPTNASEQQIALNTFLNDEKENNENQIVVDEIVEKLQILNPFQLKISPRKLLELPMLFHLITDIELSFDLSNITELALTQKAQELVLHLHPTPALGTKLLNPNLFQNSPYRSPASQWMIENLNLQQERGSFGAPLTIINEDQQKVDSFVLIRGLQWSNNYSQDKHSKNFTITAGCGVVAQSHLEKEWLELKNKRFSISSLFIG